MHKAELESSAEDIVNTVRETSRGKHKMDTREWNMLIQATDELYPDFKDALTEKLGHIDENEPSCVLPHAHRPYQPADNQRYRHTT